MSVEAAVSPLMTSRGRARAGVTLFVLGFSAVFGGVVLVLLGMLQLSGAWSELMLRLQGLFPVGKRRCSAMGAVGSGAARKIHVRRRRSRTEHAER